MKAFAQAEWDKATRALSSAKLLIERDPDSAVSRAYYAVFHALTAVLALRGRSFSRHTAIRAALHRDLIKTELLPAECGRDFDYLLDMRDMADYGGLAQATPSSAADATAKAEGLIVALRALMEW